MDPRVEKLSTPEACERFIRNAIKRDRLDLVREARLRAVELRADSYGTSSEAERGCLQAIYAYEEVLTRKNGRRTRARRTWQMIDRHGILEAAQRAVDRDIETSGYTALVEMGLQEYAFEAVILRHPELFSENSLQRSQERMAHWGTDDAKTERDND